VKEIRAALGSGVIAVALDADAPQIFVTVSPDLLERGISAGELVKVAMKPMEGRGGGRPEMARAWERAARRYLGFAGDRGYTTNGWQVRHSRERPWHSGAGSGAVRRCRRWPPARH